MKGLIVLIFITWLQSGGFSFGTPAGGGAAGGGGFSFGGGAASAQPAFGSTGVCLPFMISIHNRILIVRERKEPLDPELISGVCETELLLNYPHSRTRRRGHICIRCTGLRGCTFLRRYASFDPS